MITMPTLSVSFAYLIARLSLALMFVQSAVNHALHFQSMVVVLSEQGLPFPMVLLPLSMVVEVIGVISLVSGKYIKLGAALLFIFVLSSTLVFFPFWELEGFEQQEAIQNVVKNVALLGLLVLIFALNGDEANRVG